MKCSRCEYFNVPGATQCGRCGHCFDAHAETDSDGFAPPRARDRNLKAQIRAYMPLRESSTRSSIVSPRTTTAREEINELTSNIRSRVWSMRRNLEWMVAHHDFQSDSLSLLKVVGLWVAVIMSFAPGLGQLFQKRFALASALSVASCLTLLLAWFCRFNVLSNVLLYVWFSLSWFSVWDAMNHSFPDALNDGKSAFFLRDWKLRFLSLGVVAVIAFVSLLCASARYSLATINFDNMRGALHSGDGLIIENLDEGAAVRRGDIVTTDNYYVNLERIVGIGGDTIEVKGGVMSRNGVALSADELPLTFGAGHSTANDNVVVTVPPAQFLVWREILYEGVGEGNNVPYVFLSAATMTGRVVAIINPPSRRQRIESTSKASIP